MKTRDQVDTEIANVGTEIRDLETDMEYLCFERESIVDAENKAYTESDEGKKANGMVKLHTVPRDTWISLNHNAESLYFFDHIDGMHSYCLSLNGLVAHIAASTLVWVHDIPKLYRPDFEFENEDE